MSKIVLTPQTKEFHNVVVTCPLREDQIAEILSEAVAKAAGIDISEVSYKARFEKTDHGIGIAGSKFKAHITLTKNIQPEGA
ncbi:MAG: hypothetical protein PVI43_00205 [Candidatus Bathyarchaeota archaeon]|jgi:hypothetical protein